MGNIQYGLQERSWANWEILIKHSLYQGWPMALNLNQSWCLVLVIVSSPSLESCKITPSERLHRHTHTHKQHINNNHWQTPCFFVGAICFCREIFSMYCQAATMHPKTSFLAIPRLKGKNGKSDDHQNCVYFKDSTDKEHCFNRKPVKDCGVTKRGGLF